MQDMMHAHYPPPDEPPAPDAMSEEEEYEGSGFIPLLFAFALIAIFAALYRYFIQKGGGV